MVWFSGGPTMLEDYILLPVAAELEVIGFSEELSIAAAFIFC